MDFYETLEKLNELQTKEVAYRDEKELDSLEADKFRGNKSVKILQKDPKKKKAKVMVGTASEMNKITQDKAKLVQQLGLQK